MSSNTIPENQNQKLTLDQGYKGLGSCNFTFFGILLGRVQSPGLELFLKHFCCSPPLGGKRGSWSICSILICICTLSCIHYLTSLGLGRGSGAECGSSMCFPEPCGELSQTVNETVARTGQEPALAGHLWAQTQQCPANFEGSSCARVT